MVPAGHIAQSTPPHTAAEDLHALGLDPAALDSRMHAMLNRVTKTTPVTVTMPPVQTGLVREALTDPIGLQVQEALQLDGVRLRVVQSDGQQPRLELVDARHTPLSDRLVTPRETGGFTVSGGPLGAVHHFSPQQTFEFRTLPLPGTPWQLRFETATGLDGPIRVARPDGTPVSANRHGVDIVRERPDLLTVQVQMPDANGARTRTATWLLGPDNMVRETLLAGEETGDLSDLTLRQYIGSGRQVTERSPAKGSDKTAGGSDALSTEVWALRGGAREKRLVDVPAADYDPRRTLTLLNARAIDAGEAPSSVPRVASMVSVPPVDKLNPSFPGRYNNDRDLLERLAGGGTNDPTFLTPHTEALVNQYRPGDSWAWDEPDSYGYGGSPRRRQVGTGRQGTALMNMKQHSHRHRMGAVGAVCSIGSAVGSDRQRTTGTSRQYTALMTHHPHGYRAGTTCTCHRGTALTGATV